MDVQVYDDPRQFRAAYGDLYSADPVRHTLALTVIRRFVEDDNNLDGDRPVPVMLTAHHDGRLHGVALRTPPWPLIVSGLPADAAPAAAARLHQVDPDLPGVNGPRELSEAFAAAWAAHTGAATREVMAGRLYGLGDLRPPGVPGRARLATEADLPLLVEWRRAFLREAVGHEHPHDFERQLRRYLEIGDALVLWEHDDRTVSWAGASAPVAGMSRIGPVYTPHDQRGHGYGSAVTAAASRWALDAGAEHVLLFTDLANPTSNSIYQKIGYRPVSDIAEIAFTAPFRLGGA
ncbi:GNAT family N-acetyltransferase [Actinophytocola gossypii]|uniref:GNAT family N-acetyltransferase n=1 Tax=Actinophytocola gossypii TaxID=2812003 RepID=A0ABT2JJW1_9PSEU|nr:GNAT family N-acetyltransferase [Actinophytocola gossypii]MCT2588179.1 GNAT family N-acetyltransferase [Actinophytocola gossypii]